MFISRMDIPIIFCLTDLILIVNTITISYRPSIYQAFIMLGTFNALFDLISTTVKDRYHFPHFTDMIGPSNAVISELRMEPR